MFDLCFTGEVVCDEGVTQHLGVMTLGEITVGIGASFSLWSEREYKRQWLEAARRLCDLDSCSAFITDVGDPPTPYMVKWSPAWHVNDLIIFQSELLFIGAEEGDEAYNLRAAKFSLEDPYAAIPDRDEAHTEECRKTQICRHPKIGSTSDYANTDLCGTEWCVYPDEIREFVERRARDWRL